MNEKIDASQDENAKAVKIVDLQGKSATLKLAKPVSLSSRQKAQQANDKGLLLYKQKQYSEAEAQFTEALKLRPDFALAANNLGFICYKQEHFDEAALWFANAVKMDPSRAVAYRNLGDALAKSGNKADAKKNTFQTYLALQATGDGPIMCERC